MFKAKPLDLDAVLKRPNLRNQVKLVGVELEGGWDNLPAGTNLTHDGSIQLQTTPAVAANTIPTDAAAARRILRDMAANRLGFQIGELPSDPMEPGRLRSWMKKYYPNHVNETCGMHVHMSFKHPLQYQRLMTELYPSTVVAYMTKWAKVNLSDDHHIWKRLSNKSVYCQHKFMAETQILNATKDHDRQRNGHRYTVINYCWERYNTIECRLLPMMDTVDLGISAVEHLLNVTNAFLVTYREREPRVRAEVIVERGDEREIEVRREYV